MSEEELELSGFEEVEDSNGEAPPLPSSPEWTDYVLGHLTNEEKVNNAPTVDGLRRVTELLLGEIISSSTQVVQVPTPENEKRATVVVTVVVRLGENEERVVSGAADVYWGNTDKPFRNHPVATAESRAESRALRRLLKIKTIAAEELAQQLEDEIGDETVGNINKPQLTHLDLMCSTHDINVKKLVNKLYPECNNMKELKYADGTRLFKEVQTFIKTQVPEDVVGYDNKWQSELGV